MITITLPNDLANALEWAADYGVECLDEATEYLDTDEEKEERASDCRAANEAIVILQKAIKDAKS